MRPRLRRVTLEMSLKPFPSFDEASVRAVAREMFRQWHVLLDDADAWSVMLWVADGSELLDWAGRDADPVDWARFIGFCNTDADPYGHVKTADRVGIPYREDPPVLDYADLRRIVRVLREEGERLGHPTTIVATFDPGPEFAPSAFKYRRHPEIVASGADAGIGPVIRMVQHSATLAAESRDYAAFPDGIAEGTSFGTFLGRQAQSYLTAIGFDGLWLSNGFGFSAFPWSELGAAFDGDAFHAERLPRLRSAALAFWDDLARECAFPIEVRGTNHSTGIDLGADGVPALEVYERGIITGPPPNSPWGPLNEDFGIEIAGYLSRIAMLPQGAPGYRFRFYANDPWFWQQPWWDFYGREPFDIDLPLAVSRVTRSGRVQPPDEVNILTVDTARGVLDERCAREVSGAIRRARETPPDSAGPVVWVYPFREIHERAVREPDSAAQAFAEDAIAAAAISAGLPMSTVVSTDDLRGALDAGALDDRVLVVPAGALTDAVAEDLARHVASGGHVVAYGTLVGRSPRALALLGLSTPETGASGPSGPAGSGVQGDLVLSLAADAGLGRDLGAQVERAALTHTAALSGGAIVEQSAGAAVLATAIDALGRAAAYASRHRPNPGGGTAIWIRGSAPEVASARGGAPALDAGALLRDAVGLVGPSVSHELRTPDGGRVVIGIHRHRDALWFSGHQTDTTTRVRLRLPGGAPILVGRDAWLDGGDATYQLDRSFRLECRALVRQDAASRVGCRELAPSPASMTRALELRGLVDAAVELRLPPGTAAEARIEVAGRSVAPDRDGDRLGLQGVTGTLTVAWRDPVLAPAPPTGHAADHPAEAVPA